MAHEKYMRRVLTVVYEQNRTAAFAEADHSLLALALRGIVTERGSLVVDEQVNVGLCRPPQLFPLMRAAN